MSKYFGTDGIRGVIDKTLNSKLAYLVGKSIAINIIEKNLTKKVIIGKDTRVSGDVIAYSVACGLIDYGIDVYLLGIVPTGCVSYLSSRNDIGYGIMITASHNSPDMNGIKIINNLGYKLSYDEEENIEKFIDADYDLYEFYKGTINNGEYLVEKYENHILSVASNLSGIKVALDCAYGSNYKLAPKIFRKLGAEVVEINCENKGENINVNCGALNVAELKQEVIKHKCDIGFAFDGDADRLIVVTKDGKELSGDELLYLFAKHLKSVDQLNSLKVVGTIMTNLGCEESLKKFGINLVRVDVGDRNVIEKMRENNFSLGGESSGHICFHSYNTTCDALINALQLLKIINNNFSYVDMLLLEYKKYSSKLKNIVITDEFRKDYNGNNAFLDELNDLIKSYSDVKIIVRPSGTESVLRILVEGIDSSLNEKALMAIEKFIKNYLKNSK